MKTATLLAAGSLLIVSAGGCGGSGGGIDTSNLQCQEQNYNSGPDAVHLGYVLTTPKCPYKVKQIGNSVPFEFVVSADVGPTSPPKNFVLEGSLLSFWLKNNTAQNPYINLSYPFYSSIVYPGVPAGRVAAIITSSFPGGYGSSPSTHGKGGNEVAKVDFTYYLAGAPGTPLGGHDEYILYSVIDTSKSSVIGATSVNAAASGVWRAYPAWDTTSYTFQWLKDGQLVSGATGAAYSTSLNTAGSHTLKVITTGADLVSDTATVSVTALFTVTIDGPSPVRANNSCLWTASVQGGGAGITYAWKKNGSTIGTNSPELTTSFSSAGTLFVQVTDGYGNVASATKSVGVSSSASTCQF